MIPVATLVTPKILCPHPCPTPGRASYSASIAILGVSLPKVNFPIKAVGNPAKPVSTSKPYFFKIAV